MWLKAGKIIKTTPYHAKITKRNEKNIPITRK